MKKSLFLFILAALTMVSCQESMKQLSDRVFEVAEYQFAEMDKNLTETTVPKSTRFGVLVPSESKSWTSGFYPGSLGTLISIPETRTLRLLPRKTQKNFTSRLRSYAATISDSW